MKHIPKEKLIELYVEKKMTTFEIAEIYNVDRSTISNKLHQYQIDIDPTQRKYKILKAIPLTKEQKEFIVGCTLGDGSVICSGRRVNSYFKVSHCEKQKDYLLWKKVILGNLVNNITRYEDKRKNSVMYSFHTITHHEMNFFQKLFYENNKKVVRNDIGLHLTSLGLAVWFMDNGTLMHNQVNYRFSTDGFTRDENHMLSNIMKANFDLNVKVCEYERQNKKYYYLSLNKRNAMNMTEIILPHMVDCMKYKIMFSKYCSSTTECQKSSNEDCDIV